VAYMMKQDSMGYYNVEYDESTGEIIFDPRAVIITKPVEEKPKPKTVAEFRAAAKAK